MFKTLREAVGRLFARVFRRGPPAPGHFVSGKKMSLSGWLNSVPWLWPSREYLVYVPRGYGGWKRRALVVMIHGCRQTPEEFAAATRITQLADEHGWLVLLPRQSEKANSWSCWNWFDPATTAGRGEAAIVAAQVRAVRRRYRIHPRRIVAAGFSAGGGLAAALGVRHRDLFSGVFVHSGLACGAASGPSEAVNVMRRGANAEAEKIGMEARSKAPGDRLPLLVLQGDVDDVVAEINAVHLVRQFLALNGRDLGGGSRDALPPPDVVATEKKLPGGHRVTTTEYRDGKRMLAQRVRIVGLGHAWSGGDPTYPFNDPAPPDATVLLARFVEERSRPAWRWSATGL